LFGSSGLTAIEGLVSFDPGAKPTFSSVGFETFARSASPPWVSTVNGGTVAKSVRDSNASKNSRRFRRRRAAPRFQRDAKPREPDSALNREDGEKGVELIG